MKIGQKLRSFFDKVSKHVASIDDLMQRLRKYGVDRLPAFRSLFDIADRIIRGASDLLNPSRLLALFGPLQRPDQVEQMVKKVAKRAGGIEQLSPAQHQNLVRAAQHATWNAACCCSRL